MSYYTTKVTFVTERATGTVITVNITVLQETRTGKEGEIAGTNNLVAVIVVVEGKGE